VNKVPVLSYLESLGRRKIAVMVLLMLGFVAYLDYATPVEVSFLTIYWIPVALATWLLGRAWGLGIGLFAVAFGTITEWYQGRRFDHTFFFVWETATRTVSFVIFAWMVAELRRAHKEQEQAKAGLETVVKKRTQHLERTVGQLKAFSYSVAHDLRRPARSASVFSEIALTSGKGVDEETRKNLERIVDAGRRINGMLDGLLQLSRLSQAQPAPESVDLTALARSVVDELKAQEPGRRVEVVLPAGRLEVRCDPNLMRILLQNLLENAWKFTSRASAARVEFGAQTADGEKSYFVKDNGIGFDPAYSDQLFQPFHRLPSAEGFPGMGVGLASAASVIEAHGGRLWAQGRPNQGAEFRFTLEQSE
jgi:signal transduction histidine kinase